MPECMLRTCATIGMALLMPACAWFGGPDPKDARLARAEYELASDAFHRQRHRAALGHVLRSIEFDDENADAHYLKALTLLTFCVADAKSTDCRYDDAEAASRRALELNPQLRDARNVLGVILVHQDKPAQAIEVLKPLATDMLYGSPDKAWGNLGWAQLRAGQVDEAIDSLSRSVAAQPKFCVGYYRLGLAYEKKGRHKAAHQAFGKALGLPDGRCSRLQAAFFARSRVAGLLGRKDEQRQDLLQCQDLGVSTDVGRQCAKRLQSLQ